MCLTRNSCNEFIWTVWEQHLLKLVSAYTRNPWNKKTPIKHKSVKLRLDNTFFKKFVRKYTEKQTGTDFVV